MEDKQTEAFKSGFIGIVGPTNSGKSTLMNHLVGQKVSIVSRRVQTTYHGVRGILNQPSYQFVFTDTPGYQRHPDSVARLLNRVADRNAKDCDLLVWVFDASNPTAFQQCADLKDNITSLKPREMSYCVLNKVDKIPKEKLLPLIQKIHELSLFSDIIPLSARTGENLDRLLTILESHAPEGQKMFPEDAITDRPQQFLVSELIREKIYEVTLQEIPYSVWVEIEAWETPEGSKCPTIRAVIHVDSKSRKGILIGKQGQLLKEVGTRARADIEKLLGHQVCLKLHVDVEEAWKQDGRHLNRYLELN